MLLFAALAYPQAATKTADENRGAAADQATAAADQATKEAQRQGKVALKPEANQSPAQTVDQAIAFERYKELAAQREARKQGNASEADRSLEKAPAKAKPAKKR